LRFHFFKNFSEPVYLQGYWSEYFFTLVFIGDRNDQLTTARYRLSDTNAIAGIVDQDREIASGYGPIEAVGVGATRYGITDDIGSLLGEQLQVTCIRFFTEM
jgi:hypothetical protein